MEVALESPLGHVRDNSKNNPWNEFIGYDFPYLPTVWIITSGGMGEGGRIFYNIWIKYDSKRFPPPPGQCRAEFE